MPFNKNTAALAGKKGGNNRWLNKDPDTNRNKRISLKVTHAEFDFIETKAATAGLSKTELLMRAVKAFKV